MRSIIFVASLWLIAFGPITASASILRKEAGAEASGVVPKFNEDGSLRALIMYGEGDFSHQSVRSLRMRAVRRS